MLWFIGKFGSFDLVEILAGFEFDRKSFQPCSFDLLIPPFPPSHRPSEMDVRDLGTQELSSSESDGFPIDP